MACIHPTCTEQSACAPQRGDGGPAICMADRKATGDRPSVRSRRRCALGGYPYYKQQPATMCVLNHCSGYTPHSNGASLAGWLTCMLNQVRTDQSSLTMSHIEEKSPPPSLSSPPPGMSVPNSPSLPPEPAKHNILFSHDLLTCVGIRC